MEVRRVIISAWRLLNQISGSIGLSCRLVSIKWSIKKVVNVTAHFKSMKQCPSLKKLLAYEKERE